MGAYHKAPNEAAPCLLAIPVPLKPLPMLTVVIVGGESTWTYDANGLITREDGPNGTHATVNLRPGRAGASGVLCSARRISSKPRLTHFAIARMRRPTVTTVRPLWQTPVYVRRADGCMSGPVSPQLARVAASATLRSWKLLSGSYSTWIHERHPPSKSVRLPARYPT
jgi:hypothetical protein